jgi:hypothetical protein
MDNSVKLYSLNLTQTKGFLFALMFIAGNVVLPQLCHLMPQGGLIFLPIYFFTLIGAYKYGWQVGLLTAVASPLVNNALFGMPPAPMVPIVLVKSVLLATAAALVARRSGRVSVPSLLLVVLLYQVPGSMVEWAMTGNAGAALQDVRLGIPGLLVQIIGGYFVIRYLLRK